MASKSYGVIFPVIEASTDIMKDHSILSVPFSVLEPKHKCGKACCLYLHYQWSHFHLPNQECWHDNLTCFV